MSASTDAAGDQDEPGGFECAECGGPRAAETSVAGSYCSERCLYRARGRKALRQVEQDHRWCATCFRRLKTVHRPPDQLLERTGVSQLTRESFVGYENRTPHAVDGVDESDHEDPRHRETFTRTSCECGTVDPTDQHAILRNLDPKQTVQSLWRCLVALERDGTFSTRPDKGAFVRALKDSNRDWHYAIGRALYSG